MTEQQSTRHSPRLDEELDRDWHRAEPRIDDEPHPDAVITLDEVELRSMLATSLRPSAFPGDRAGLMTVALEQHAPDSVLVLIGSLPPQVEYPTVEAVWEALGGRRETRDHAPAETEAKATATATATPEAEPEGEPEAEDDIAVVEDEIVIERGTTPADRVMQGAGIVVGAGVAVALISLGVARAVVHQLRRLF